jgi:uncharacterized phage-associated protein
MNVHDVTDYLVWKASAAGMNLNLLKVQKLAYYAEAWHLAIHGKPLTNSEFQAWIHGPVSRELYDRFKGSKSLYSSVDEHDLRPDFNPDGLSEDVKRHLDDVLEAYGPFSGSQMEEMSHREDPWLAAREGYRTSERCEVTISPEHMRTYYSARIHD